MGDKDKAKATYKKARVIALYNEGKQDDLIAKIGERLAELE